MKMILAALLIASVVHCRAQAIDLAKLGSQCVPEAPLTTLSAVVYVESGGNPNAMQIDFPKTLLKRWRLPAGALRLQRQPANTQEALAWLRYFEAHGVSVDLGLMQVSTAEANRRGVSRDSLLEPCANLRIGWRIFEDAYRIEAKAYGPGQEALRHALSRYNTGDTLRGFDNGYVGRVLDAVRRVFTAPVQERRHSND